MKHVSPDMSTRSAVLSTVTADVKAPYFGWRRDDILALVPATVSRALSIGCGEGATEAELVARGVSVTGLELNPAAAEVARSRGVHVICTDAANNTGMELGNARFDLLIYADVLEHIADPEAVLRRHIPRLLPGGWLIISVPNFRHHSVLSALFVHGEIRYTDAGVLDRTHVRITTRRMVERWVGEQGLQTVRSIAKISRRRGRWANAVTFGLLREFLARQIIVVAQWTPGERS